MTPQEISFSLLNLLSVIHLKWTVDGGVFIPLPFIPKWSSAATSSGWWTLSLAFLSPSYDLSLIIVIYS
jgi:hypothetical protein